MKHSVERLRLVVLESPYDSWSHPLTENLFAKLVGLKIRGYARAYPYGILAADASDLISDHLLVCEETGQGLRPIFGLKSVPLRKCEAHGLPFPGLSIVEAAQAPLHCKSVNKIIMDAKYNNVDLRYGGSLTIDPDHHGDKEWSRTLRELFTTMYVNFHLSLPRVELIVGGTLRFKMDDYVIGLGHMPIELNDQVLKPIRVAHLSHEEVLWTHLREFSFESRQTAKKWQKMWDNRLHIAPAAREDQRVVKKAA